MTSQNPLPPAPASVVAQILKLPELSVPALRERWRALFNSEAPNCGRRFLERRIAYRVQEIEAQKTHQALLERNTRRIAELVEAEKPNAPAIDYSLVPGTVLTREYHGVEYEVLVAADGTYLCQGRPYRSLSELARQITGARWSGPLFFGLKARGAKR